MTIFKTISLSMFPPFSFSFPNTNALAGCLISFGLPKEVASVASVKK
jgi:hypothetical protein